MYYSLILLATVLFGLQFLFNKTYQTSEGTGLTQAVIFNFGTAIVTIVAMLIVNKGMVEWTPFSLIVATIYAINAILLAYFMIAALSQVNLSLFSLFAMLGGMILPFVAGVLLYGESFTLKKIIALIVIFISLLLGADLKGSKKTFFYCSIVFLLNGMSGVISKWHQSGTNIVSSSQFMLLKGIITVIICGMILVVMIEKKGSLSLAKPKQAIASMTLFGIMNSLANFLILVSLIHVEASVQYPMITGGTIVVSAMISLFLREKMMPKNLVAVALALLSTFIIM